MSNQERASLGFDDEDSQEIPTKDQISLEELTGATEQPKPTPQQQKALIAEGAKHGFVSREPKKRRRVSPYTAQFGGKCREGMKSLFQDIGEHLGCYDTETLDKAILALIEKEGLQDKAIGKQYRELIK